MSQGKATPSLLSEALLLQAVDSVPGGVFSCLFDPPLTLLQVNDGFLSMLGYTRADIHDLYQDSFWEMIYPPDREKALQEAIEQMAQGLTKELEYRMVRKDGTAIWVLDQGRLVRTEKGQDAFCCMLVDITRSKELEARLRLLINRHQVILNQSTDILFEWDTATDRLDCSQNWFKRFGTVPPEWGSDLQSGGGRFVWAEDRPVLLALMEDIRTGNRYGEVEVRLLRADGAPLWCRIRITGLHDDVGAAGRAVGIIIDIEREKEKSLALLEIAQRDALTRLYNKAVSRQLAEQSLARMAEGDLAALLILDLDNFKSVNDTMGHLYGDALLVEVARLMEQQFAADEILGRVGGDEFMVLLPHLATPEAAETQANALIARLNAMAAREFSAGTVSCSAGIALAPRHSRSFQDLFHKADLALYQAKSLGKHRCVVYDEEEMLLLQPSSAVCERIDSNENKITVSAELMEYVFSALYQSENLDTSVDNILKIVGRYFDVSRVYIFENTTDDRYCCNTYEWCNDGVAPEKDNLAHISYEEDLGGCYQQNFNSEGIFYCRDIQDLPTAQYDVLAPQGIKSLLQCAIRDKSGFRGFVGFDECKENRFWTQEQVNSLTFVAQILSTFLLKHRAQEEAAQNAVAMEAVLDGQDSWIYVIRPDTYEMLYINRKTRELAPAAAVGMTCYSVYFNRQSPCDFCPLKNIGPSGRSEARTIYNPEFNVWSSTEACRINWKGAEAVLLTCHDVTAFMPDKH